MDSPEVLLDAEKIADIVVQTWTVSFLAVKLFSSTLETQPHTIFEKPRRAGLEIRLDSKAGCGSLASFGTRELCDNGRQYNLPVTITTSLL